MRLSGDGMTLKIQEHYELWEINVVEKKTLSTATASLRRDF